MHRRSTDALEREIEDWEHIRRALGPGSLPVARDFVDERLDVLRAERAMRDRPQPWGRRATDPKPTLIMLHP